MDQIITLPIATRQRICKTCGSREHEWFQVYYEDKSKLKKANNLWMAWCETNSEYVFTSRKII